MTGWRRHVRSCGQPRRCTSSGRRSTGAGRRCLGGQRRGGQRHGGQLEGSGADGCGVIGSVEGSGRATGGQGRRCEAASIGCVLLGTYLYGEHASFARDFGLPVVLSPFLANIFHESTSIALFYTCLLPTVHPYLFLISSNMVYSCASKPGNSDVQRQLMSLLQRKGSWAAADVERFAGLCRDEHGLEGGVAAAKVGEGGRAEDTGRPCGPVGELWGLHASTAPPKHPTPLPRLT